MMKYNSRLSLTYHPLLKLFEGMEPELLLTPGIVSMISIVTVGRSELGISTLDVVTTGWSLPMTVIVDAVG